MAFSADGKYILTGDDAGKATLWNVSSGESVWHTQVGSEIYSVAFSQDGQYFAIGYHGQAGVWRTSNGTQIFTRNIGYTYYGYYESPVYAVALSPNGTYFATGDPHAQEANLWAISSGEGIGELRHGYTYYGYYASPVYAVAFSPDGQYLTTGDDDGDVNLWFYI